MKTKGMKTVKLSELKENLFIRKELNQDHVLYLAELIENGVEMKDFIETTEDFQIVDGRHRKEAYELNKIDEIKVRILEFENEAEMIAYAYKANTGGSLPPSPEDTEHTIILLLGCSETKKRIGELLGLPIGMARRYINVVQSKTARAKLLRAKEAVTDGGLTVAKSAEQYDVDIDKLKEELLGHRQKCHKEGIAEIQRNLTKTHSSLSHKNAASIRRLLEQHEDGDVTERQVRNIFSHIEQLQKRSARAVKDWKQRFESMNNKANTVGV